MQSFFLSGVSMAFAVSISILGGLFRRELLSLPPAKVE